MGSGVNIVHDLLRGTGTNPGDPNSRGGSDAQRGLEKFGLDNFDANGNGKIDSGAEEEAFGKAISPFDKNGDERLDDEEISNFMLDRDGDGSVSKSEKGYAFAHPDEVTGPQYDENQMNAFFGGKDAYDKAKGAGATGGSGNDGSDGAVDLDNPDISGLDWGKEGDSTFDNGGLQEFFDKIMSYITKVFGGGQ